MRFQYTFDDNGNVQLVMDDEGTVVNYGPLNLYTLPSGIKVVSGHRVVEVLLDTLNPFPFNGLIYPYLGMKLVASDGLHSMLIYATEKEDLHAAAQELAALWDREIAIVTDLDPDAALGVYTSIGYTLEEPWGVSHPDASEEQIARYTWIG